MEETIGEIAVKLMENKLKTKDNCSEGILCVGPKGAGKTTLLNVLLDKEDSDPKETLSLEYTFGRKNIVGQYAEKSVCHVWELGGSMLPTAELVNVPLGGGGATCCVLVVDLADGPSLWTPLKEFTTRILDSAPLPLYFVGMKYDLYRQLDAKQKTTVNKMLRAAALLTAGGVFMFSHKEPALIRKAKEILNHIAFGQASPIKTYLGDAERPLQVAPGGRDDSWQNLGCMGALSWSEVGEWLGGVKQWNDDRAVNSNKVQTADPSLEAIYREPLVDALRTRKDHQLELALASSQTGHSYL